MHGGDCAFYQKATAVPARTTSYYPGYGAAHVALLRFIRHCRALDMTHQEIRMLPGLMDEQAGDSGGVNRLAGAHMVHGNTRSPS